MEVAKFYFKVNRTLLRADIKIAVNICDLDGDRLNDISFNPESKYL